MQVSTFQFISFTLPYRVNTDFRLHQFALHKLRGLVLHISYPQYAVPFGELLSEQNKTQKNVRIFLLILTIKTLHLYIMWLAVGGKCCSLLCTECEVNCHGNVIWYYLCNEERFSVHFQRHFPSMIIFIYYTTCFFQICKTFSCFRGFCSTEAYVTILLCSCHAILLRHNEQQLRSRRQRFSISGSCLYYRHNFH